MEVAKITDFTVSPGQPIRASHVNQFSRWLTAVTKSHTTAITNTHASEYTLTLTNEVATGNILKLGYGTGTAVAVAFGATLATFSSAVLSKGVVAINLVNNVVPTNSTLLVAKTETAASHVLADFGLTVGSAGQDSGAIRAVVAQSVTGVSSERAVEAQAIRESTAGTGACWGIEVGVHSGKTGPDASYNNGIHIEFNSSFMSGTAVADGAGVWVGGAVGCLYPFYSVDGPSNPTTATFFVHRTGGAYFAGAVTAAGLTSGSLMPLTTTTSNLGTAARSWLAMYALVGAWGLGAVNAPSITNQTNTLTGFYFPTATQVGSTLNGTMAWLASISGVQFSTAVQVQKTTSPATPASGYSALVPHTDESWKRITATGGTVQMMDASLIGRRNRLINGDFQIWQRGTSAPTATDNTYGPDRWRLIAETNTSATIAQGTSAVVTGAGHFNCVLTVGAGNNNKFGIFQPIEGANIWDLRGTVASLQMRLHVSNTRIGTVKASIVQWASTEDGVSGDPIATWGGEGTVSALTTWSYANTPTDATSGSFTMSTTAALYKVENVAISATATNLGVLIIADDKTQTAADTLTISDVQLEPGAVCTNFERRHQSEEERLCRRYTIQRKATGLAQVFAFGQAYNATGAIVYFPLGINMRTAPTLAFSTGPDFNLATAGFGTASLGTNAIFYSYVDGVAAMQITGTTSMTAGNVTMLLSSTTTAFVRWDAEL